MRKVKRISQPLRQKEVKRMSTMNITFKHPDEIIDFLKTVCKFDFNMDMRRGRAVVDAKSLLGIMNLD